MKIAKVSARSAELSGPIYLMITPMRSSMLVGRSFKGYFQTAAQSANNPISHFAPT